MRSDRDLLDIAEAAAFLNVSETSLRRWTNAGELPCLRIGKRRERRFRREDLLAFLNATGVASRAEASTATEGHALIDGVAVPHGTHQCGFYTSDIGRVQLAVRFLAGGMRPDSVCFLAGPRKLREPIVRELGATQPVLRQHLEDGTLVLSEYEKTGDKQIEYWESAIQDAQRRGARSIRIVGDVSGFARRSESLVAYEADYTLRISSIYPVVTLCQYDVRKFSGVDLFRALKGHPDSCIHPERWLA
jgi:excisionase family DNA binding protein